MVNRVSIHQTGVTTATSLAATGEGLRDEAMFKDVYKAQLIAANNVREESHQEERIQLTM